MLLISKCRGEQDLGVCMTSVLAKRIRLHSANFRRILRPNTFWNQKSALCGPYSLHAHDLGLCLFLVRWSVICCQDGCFMASPKVHGQKSISVTILTSTAWRIIGLFGAFPILVGGHHWCLGATFLGSQGDWLWELVGPKIHASPPSLRSVLPIR